MNLPSPPLPSRGILSEIAKELGMSRQAVAQRFHNCDPKILEMVIQRERLYRKAKASALKARTSAIKKYVKAIQ